MQSSYTTYMDIKKEIVVIREILGLTQKELAQALHVAFETVNRWETGENEADISNVEKIYSFAFQNGIFFNVLYEQLLKEEYCSDNVLVLFHGSNCEISFPIDLDHSRALNDFGKGFYLGESLEQAATYGANSKTAFVYIFALDKSDLNIKYFSVDWKWMLMIAWFRGWLTNYQDNSMIQELLCEIKDADIIVAPIADNRMFDLLSQFGRGEITDLQCQHALSATNLGAQYILKSEKAVNALSLLKVSYISSSEKERYKKVRLDLHEQSMDKVKLARIEYRGKGRYIDEVLQ